MYGSSTMRAYYGAGDYQRALVQAQGAGYAGGYYAAGGFFSKVAGLAKRAGSALAAAPMAGLKLPGASKLAGGLISGIGGKLLKGVPVLGTALTAFDIGKDLYKSFRGGSGGGIASSIGKLGAMKPGKAAAVGAAAGLAVERGRRKKRRTSSRRRAPARRSRRSSRSRSRYSRGDWGDDGGRDKRGHYLNEVGGHRNFRRKRRRGRGRGERVSFTTKDGKRVSFNARGDDA